MFCEQCGKPVKPDWKFCKFCGNVLGDEKKSENEEKDNDKTTRAPENTEENYEEKGAGYIPYKSGTENSDQINRKYNNEEENDPEDAVFSFPGIITEDEYDPEEIEKVSKFVNTNENIYKNSEESREENLTEENLDRQEADEETTEKETEDIDDDSLLSAKTIVIPDEVRKRLAEEDTEIKVPKKKKVSKAAAFFKKNMAWIIPVGVVLIAGIITLAILLTRPTAFDLGEYIVPEVEGYNGSGSISSVIDTDALNEALFGPAPNNSVSGNGTSSSDAENDDYIKKTEAVLNAIFWEIDYNGKTGGSLSNGDIIKITVTADAETFKEFGFSLRETTVEKEIEIGRDTNALSDFSSIDPANFLNISFAGINGRGYVSEADPITENITSPTDQIEQMTVTGNVYYDSGNNLRVVLEFEGTSTSGGTEQTFSKNITFSASKARNLSNGDDFTLTADEDDMKELRELGISLSESEKTYIVRDLPQETEIDPLGELEISFSGENGEGELEIATETTSLSLSRTFLEENSVPMRVRRNETYYYTISLTIPDADNPGETTTITLPLQLVNYTLLLNGDTVTISIDSESQSALEEKGFILTSSSLRVTVSGLAENSSVPPSDPNESEPGQEQEQEQENPSSSESGENSEEQQ
ncbi:MAG: hypothetical protein KHW62_01000 [Clostridiales bacterium]|nr:hypothetical protein [Clostridiales bacterium]